MVIALGGTPGQAYEAFGWEIWAPLGPLYEVRSATNPDSRSCSGGEQRHSTLRDEPFPETFFDVPVARSALAAP